MASIDKTSIAKLLDEGPFRVDIGRKQLTLAFAGLYLASTTDDAKPKLVWEAEKGYPRYYVPVATLHPSVRSKNTGGSADNGSTNGAVKDVKVESLDTIKASGKDGAAVIERVSIGDRSTTWVRFTSGEFKDFVRFERSEIGECKSWSFWSDMH